MRLDQLNACQSERFREAARDSKTQKDSESRERLKEKRFTEAQSNSVRRRETLLGACRLQLSRASRSLLRQVRFVRRGRAARDDIEKLIQSFNFSKKTI